ncbi:MAG TPA: hypothetical protein VFB74_11680, partial [Kribbellaceae bacterium]|nr:hypothetical protein [Kribbellaceae bacterium]
GEGRVQTSDQQEHWLYNYMPNRFCGSTSRSGCGRRSSIPGRVGPVVGRREDSLTMREKLLVRYPGAAKGTEIGER